MEELKDQIYEALDEMRRILRKVAPEEYRRAQRYWLAHIDAALENRGNWMGGSVISYIDAIEALEEMMEMEEMMGRDRWIEISARFRDGSGGGFGKK